jgi:bifunctional ADP-heptose synthase (sugar kinase/adenylyltransferase)
MEDIQAGKKKTPLCFVGFDGFTDEIISVVNQTIDKESKTFIPTIAEFGKKILDASNKSCNFELCTTHKKMGGNAPIFTNAMLEGGHHIIFSGAIGTKNNIEPLFQKMAERCREVYPLCSSAKSDALEFSDGKIIFGKLEALNNLTYENLKKHLPLETLIEIFNSADLVVSANWTMLGYMTDIWKGILLDISPKIAIKQRYFFIDLADPAKRTDDDLREALNILKELNNYYCVILGLNIAEAERLCKLFNIEFTKPQLKNYLHLLFKALKITRILVHQAKFACLIDDQCSLYKSSFHTDKPLITTGAGDNFNAGYCNALLHGLDQEEALIIALGTAGFYVQKGKSPNMHELAQFLEISVT